MAALEPLAASTKALEPRKARTTALDLLGTLDLKLSLNTPCWSNSPSSASQEPAFLGYPSLDLLGYRPGSLGLAELEKLATETSGTVEALVLDLTAALDTVEAEIQAAVELVTS